MIIKSTVKLLLIICRYVYLFFLMCDMETVMSITVFMLMYMYTLPLSISILSHEIYILNIKE